MASTTSQLPQLAEELALVLEVATAAGQIALPYFNGAEDLDVQLKQGNSPVSAADFAVNAYLLEALMAARPNYGWLSEETLDENRELRIDAPRTFVVDPIDGTRGFIEGRDMWCVSVAIVEAGKPVVGVLICPARGEIYAATLGGGTTLNGETLLLDDAVPATMTIGGPRVFLDVLDTTTEDVIVRHPHVPSLAYRIALVATGKMQATFIKPNSHDWDIAAAGLILSEAGGALVDNNGAQPVLNQDSPVKPIMLATHQAIASNMLAIVQQTPFG